MNGLHLTDEMTEWLRENAPGHLWTETAEKFNAKFGTKTIAVNLRQVARRRNIYCGIDCRFEKGQNAWNKGKKGWCAKGTEKTRFAKGHMPHNHLPVGSEVVDNEDGYTSVKVAEPNKWRLKHIVVWEKAHHDTVKKNECVVFLDGNRKNFELSNLQKISRSVLCRMNQYNLWTSDKKLTRMAIKIAEINDMIGKRKHGYKF